MQINKFKKIAFLSLMIFLSGIVIFHFCILFKRVPYNITWGGRLENDEQMYIFETLSIFLNVVLLITLILKNNLIKHQIQSRALNGILWFYILIFGLNTIGNLFAKTNYEKLFAIPTAIFVVLLLIILNKTPEKHTLN